MIDCWRKIRLKALDSMIEQKSYLPHNLACLSLAAFAPV